VFVNFYLIYGFNRSEAIGTALELLAARRLQSGNFKVAVTWSRLHVDNFPVVNCH
jgi:hypothetical protein